ncbi:MAG: nitroreductase family protein [Firmicutes bacterium]|nr:nitroreductase family protein [Bacillota bacterium]
MDFYQLAEARQSCRNFSSTKQPSTEQITACLEAARVAPSACNSQPWHFTVCRGDLARTVAKTTQGMGMNRFTDQVPCFAVVSEEAYSPAAAAGSKIKHQDFRSLDIGIAVAHFCLAAQEQGLATCILGWFAEKDLQKALRITNHIRVVIALGIAAEDDTHRPKKRKSLEDMADFR